MTLLELIQRFTVRTGISSPTYIIGNMDLQVRQLQGLIEECLEELTQRQSWAGITREATFRTVITKDQGFVKTIADKGFKWILNETIYNRTTRLPLYGPLSASDWQALQALPASGPFYQYRIREGKLLIEPSPPVGHLCAFEYTSSFCVVDTLGTTFKGYPTADNDTFVLEDAVILAGLRWKWKYEKGLDYAEDFNRFEEFVNNSIGRDSTKPTLSLNGEFPGIRPGIFIPSGNWNI